MDEAKEFLTQSGKDHCCGLQWSRDGQEKGTLCGMSMFCCAFKKVVFITAVPITKDMCYEIRRAEACVA
jgi:hypothetical protein